MEDKFRQTTITRIERFRTRLVPGILGRRQPLTVFRADKAAATFAEARHSRLTEMTLGDKWGRSFERAWICLRGVVPDDWAGGSVVAHVDLGGEGLVHDATGKLVQGISNGSVFDNSFARDIVRLVCDCRGGETIELWIEASASGLFGLYTVADPAADAVNRYGRYEASIDAAELCCFDEARWQLWLDVRLVLGMIKALPEPSVRRRRLIHAADRAIDAYYADNEAAAAASDLIRDELFRPANATALKVMAVGHAHIDTAWLWPVDETIRKCARTFASQLDLIDRYPDYVFGASSAQHYAFIKEHYPDLYRRLKAAVKSGRWEIQGGMWVEADCNVISGESMVRQFLLGKNFFADEFGVEVDNLWLPDVFGYSANLPQIMKRSGINYFLTQKLSWNQYNEFPHHTFVWQGIDGSEILTHFPPENNYNSQLDSDSLIGASDRFKEGHFIDEFISLFGVGDGGGGPKEENIELGRRMADTEGAPKVSFGTAHEFFGRLEAYRPQLATYCGELYLELHRGTLTTQARTKKLNRQLENLLQQVEMLWSLHPDGYPRDRLDNIWKIVLRNQFHDIIPGSSITSVYHQTESELSDCRRQCHELIERAMELSGQASTDHMILFNSTSYTIRGAMDLPQSWRGHGVVDADDHPLPVQHEPQRSLVEALVPPHSFAVIRRSQPGGLHTTSDEELVLENELIRYVFGADGKLTQAYDKEYDRQVLVDGASGNVLTLYDDHPNDWDAWDIDLAYEQVVVDKAVSRGQPLRTVGDIQQSLYFKLRIGECDITQLVELGRFSKRLDFVTGVDWRAKHKMLRVSFPVSVQTDHAAFDIQYGYVRRPNHRNSSWDRARFEVVGHRYADLSEPDYGVALLNDCKYGYKVLHQTIDLCLLRSPTYPDPDADQTRHSFTYALLPHHGSLTASGVMAEAAALNRPPLVIANYRTERTALPWQIEGNGLSLEVVKVDERSRDVVLRIVETNGTVSRGRLTVERSGGTLTPVDLLERPIAEPIGVDDSIALELQPFEITTCKLSWD
ncbi:MAG: glycoside hydrolase family 38 C-terminal domain-containing protein [bacterium]